MYSDGRSSGNTRRSFLTTVGAAGALSLAGCLGSDDDDGAITWVMNPAEDTIDIEVQYQPLFDLIEEEFDVEIEGLPTQSYSGTMEELNRAGDGDRIFADTSPGAVPQLGPEEIDVVGMREAYGAEQYFGTLVTTADSGITEVSELEGEAIAMADVGSVSGGLAPLWMLQDHGLDVGNVAEGGDAEDFEWRSGVAHDLAVEELIQDDTVAAAGAGEFASVPHVPEEQIEENFPDLYEISPEVDRAGTRDPELRLLETSPPIPRAPIVVNTAWEEDLRYDIEEFMRDVESEELDHDAFELADELDLDLPDELLEAYNDPDESVDTDDYDLSEEQEADWQDFDDHTLWFSGIVEADHDDYDPVRQFADDLGISFDEI